MSGLGATRAIFLFLLFLAHYASGSFYGNLEVVLPDREKTSTTEQAAKWDFDESILQWAFTGVSTFAHLKHIKCLVEPEADFDIAVLGVPFDTAVSYRPEIRARFGPRAVRAASARQTQFRGFHHRAGLNPYTSWASIFDCGDIPVTPFDNALAVHQMTTAYTELLARRPPSFGNPAQHLHPKLVSIGGDHSIALPALQALHKLYGKPIAVLHFDAHLDTWHPGKFPSAWANSPAQSDSTTAVCLRTRLAGNDYLDYDDDETQGFLRIESDDIDSMGVAGIVQTIMDRMGTVEPVYLSVDIDVLDPGLAPGTGTPEAGGWTTRELIQVLRGIEDLNLVGADLVEVAPAYDSAGEATALSGAQIIYEILTSMVMRGLKDRGGFTKAIKPKTGPDASSHAARGYLRKTEL
ncbi:hypothetical protein HFD88_003323 [Aspergillus terreus]|nr:hypothetical protein HFD88_003323 [Aspergillus terreus]